MPERRCSYCTETPVTHNGPTFLEDGLFIRISLCEECGNSRRFYACPVCHNVYRPSPTWREWNPYAGQMAPVPCPECSDAHDRPAIKCANCGNMANSTDSLFNKRGQAFCGHCRHNIVRCRASYCRARIHPEMDGVEPTDGGTYFYCSDCALAKTVPEGAPDDYHPLSWDYREGCSCPVCSYLAGRSDRWPVADVPGHNDECSSCSVLINTSLATPASFGYICHLCEVRHYEECQDCGELEPSWDRVYVHEVGTVCDSCINLNDNYWYCESACNTWYLQGVECSCGGIHPYNYTPEHFNFLTSESERIVEKEKIPFMGIELEVEATKHGTSRTAGAQIAKDIMGSSVYIVHDGSLAGTSHSQGPGTGGEHGFEIVTHPFTWEWFHEEWPKIEGLLRTLAARGYRSWDSGRCGMHIHISRKPMSEGHQRKFINFLWGSCNLAMCIGQRTYGSQYLNAYASFSNEDRSRIMEKVRSRINPGVHNHRVALNTSKSATLEARWFRGTLNPTSFLKNVEFIHSLWYFTKFFGFSSSNEINYIKWLRDPRQAKMYPTLLDYIERNYVTRR